MITSTLPERLNTETLPEAPSFTVTALGMVRPAGQFRLEAVGDFLRHPEDPRDAIVFRPKVPVDEFVLKFVKPRENPSAGAYSM